ncbi:MAG: hypothetical protein H6Q66_1912 [Firmicutes bacterium]|nr:hypothetical protein [Bacillota bacterium]
MRKIVMVWLLVMFLLPAICLAADKNSVSVINHVMANQIEYQQGQGFVVIGPTNIKFENHSGANPSISKFTTLDQLLFMSGTYRVDINIVEDATGKVISTANYNGITFQNNNSIRSFVTDWNLSAVAGLYTYQIMANDALVASFKINIENAQ